VLLVRLAEQQSVVAGRRDHEHRGHRGGDDGAHVDVLLHLGRLLPAGSERHGQQKGEQHLNARQGNANLVQQLDQLAVDPLLRSLAVDLLVGVITHGAGKIQTS